MVYSFRIVSDEADGFRREIQIDSNATFEEFKNAICDSVGYSKNEMSSFFICDRGWEKGTEITLEDMGSDSSQDVYLMDETTLEDHIDDEGQRLMFTFDYLTDRSFYIEMRQIITGKTLLDPVVTVSRGDAPSQTIDLDEFDAKADAKAAAAAAADMDEDFYGSDGYNEDEFEGFDEMNFEE